MSIMPETNNIKTEILAINPALAEKLLGHNVNNRGIRRRMVVTYARDMEAGLWRLAGSPIVFAADGTLLDGQHRLLAVIESGCTIEFLVIYGVERAAQPVLDTGAKRSFADVLAMRGHSNNTTLAAITKQAAMWDPEDGLKTADFTPSSGQLLAFLDTQPRTARSGPAGVDLENTDPRDQPHGLLPVRLAH